MLVQKDICVVPGFQALVSDRLKSAKFALHVG